MTDESPRTAGSAADSAAGAGRSPFQGPLQALAEGGANAVVAALNHVLAQNDWARAKLGMHAQRLVRVALDLQPPAGFPAPGLSVRVTPEGFLEPVAEAELAEAGEPAVRMLLKPSIDAAFGFLREGARGLQRHLRIEGDVMLAATLGELAQQLRWDYEEDVSRVAGDVVARRVGRAVESARAGAADLGQRAESSALQYLLVEQPQLVERARLQDFAARLSALESRVEALARRA